MAVGGMRERDWRRRWLLEQPHPSVLYYLMKFLLDMADEKWGAVICSIYFPVGISIRFSHLHAHHIEKRYNAREMLKIRG